MSDRSDCISTVCMSLAALSLFLSVRCMEKEKEKIQKRNWSGPLSFLGVSAVLPSSSPLRSHIQVKATQVLTSQICSAVFLNRRQSHHDSPQPGLQQHERHLRQAREGSGESTRDLPEETVGRCSSVVQNLPVRLLCASFTSRLFNSCTLAAARAADIMCFQCRYKD